jgi:Ser-tRNA(Ala) deacylase AlaX
MNAGETGLMTTLLYLEDQYLKTCTATVAFVADDAVVLDRTILYPLGGGQASDTGTIISGSQSWPITLARRHGDDGAHLATGAAAALHAADTGTVHLDWDRRYPMMKYHTALHLLSHVAHERYGAGITGNDITTERARIDLALDELTPEMVESIAQGTNELISAGLAVTCTSVPRAEAERLVNPEKTRLDLLPAHIETIRLVRVGTVDIDACGGTMRQHERNRRHRRRGNDQQRARKKAHGNTADLDDGTSIHLLHLRGRASATGLGGWTMLPMRNLRRRVPQTQGPPPPHPARPRRGPRSPERAMHLVHRMLSTGGPANRSRTRHRCGGVGRPCPQGAPAGRCPRRGCVHGFSGVIERLPHGYGGRVRMGAATDN